MQLRLLSCSTILVSPSAFIPFCLASYIYKHGYSDLGIDMWQLLPWSRGSVKIKVGPPLIFLRTLINL
jgi:hypothetical protein